MGNPKGTKSFSSWSEFTDFVNEMPIKTIQPFVSNFNAFAGEGFYGNVVQGLVIKQLEDAVFIFGIAIDGTLIFRKRNYPDVSTWEDPKIIIHSNNWHKIYFVTDLGELIGTATSNKSGLMSPKLYCAIPNSYVVNGATELKGKYVKIISVNDWNGSIINVKVSNYGNGSYFYIILCLATNNIGRWVSGKLIAGNISGFSFYRVDKSIYMFIPDSIPDLYVTLDASMGNVSYGEEYENTIDLSNPITISWHNSLSTLDLGELLPTASNEKKGLMPAGGVSRIPYFRYSSDNVYKLEYPFYGIVGGHSDRTNTTSLYVMEVDRIYKIYATSGNTISFKKDSDGNVYASGGDGGFKFYVIPFNGRIVEVYSGDISNFEQISVL